MDALKPIAGSYLDREIKFLPGDRLHRLAARLCDSWIDDLTDEAILSIETFVDEFRLTHASGGRL